MEDEMVDVEIEVDTGTIWLVWQILKANGQEEATPDDAVNAILSVLNGHSATKEGQDIA